MRALPLALFLGLLPLAPPSRAALLQDPPSTEEPQRLEAWPEEPDGLDKEVQRLRKAGTEVMAEEARAALLAMGAGAAPELIRALARERDAEARGRVAAVLGELLDARHTRLLAVEFAHDESRVRQLALGLCARHPDPQVREAAEAALERARAAREKASGRGKELPEEEREEAYWAALACTSAGSLAGIPELAAVAASGWAEHGGRIRDASRGARGEEAARALQPLLSSGERDQRLAGLRLAAGLATEQDTRLVAPFLDDRDNSLRIAAINALRGMVDGEPPLERISAFQAIELAGQWKERL